jgi:hypothetical protein
MKKIILGMLLALFVGSSVPSFAADDNEDGCLEKTASCLVNNVVYKPIKFAVYKPTRWFCTSFGNAALKTAVLAGCVLSAVALYSHWNHGSVNAAPMHAAADLVIYSSECVTHLLKKAACTYLQMQKHCS